jgi:Tfp pilus assembly protein PilP
MVEDPEGVGHTLRVGSRLGRNGGRVTRISATGIVVVEEFVDPLGKRVRVPITMKLPEDAKLNIQTQ